MFKIISDGSCDFSTEEVKKFNIDVIPFYITFDQENFVKEGVDISKEDYFNKLKSEKNLYPKTSQPNPNDYIEECRPHLEAGDDILIITVSSKLSGSYNSARIATDILIEDYPGRTIKIIDSLNACIGQGLILREIIKMRDAGFSLEKTTEIATEILQTTRIYFTLDSLEYLKRGGRVGPTTALVGGILGLRPILQLEQGEVTQLDNVRGKKKAMKLIEEGIVEAIKDEKDNINFSIGHISSEKEAVNFKSNIESNLNFTIANPITEVGATIGTHTGPGAIAFAYCKKYETFNQKEA